MIGTLLRQLFPALGRFVLYHARRPFGGTLPPTAPAPPTEVRSPAAVAASTATAASIAELDPDIGLDARYLKPVQWPTHRTNVPTPELAADAVYKLWTTIPGGHKWTHYFAIYEAVFGPRRAEPLRILEIGVLGGASLKLWRQYFVHPDTVIVGIDIAPDCIEFDAPAAGIRVRIGSQADPEFLRRVVREFGPFDLIIDDGSHHSSHIIATFNHLFDAGLKDSGIYFVEDLHANYWHPWRDSQRSFLDVCKELLEHLHAHYRSASPAAFMVQQASDQPNTSLDVPLITTMIREIRILDSVVVIYKTHRAHVPYYLRTH
jgi:hypothetical protein